MCGRPGTLQFYDHETDRHISEVEVVPFNAVNRGDSAAEKGHGHAIEHVAFSGGGEWMVTVDRRKQLGAVDSGNMDEQTHLKFWSWRASTAPPAASGDAGEPAAEAAAETVIVGEGQYVLDTTMEEPHKSPVTALCHHPTLPLAVTASEDFTFKVWALKDVAHQRGFNDASAANRTAWFCQSAGGYREQPARCAAFSPDGSILAVGYKQVVTLWDPETCTLHQTLTHPPAAHTIDQLGFTGEGGAAGHPPCLVACSSEWIHIWNLLTLEVAWSVQLPGVQALATHPTATVFGVAAAAGVYILDGAHPGFAEPPRALAAAQKADGKKKRKGQAGGESQALLPGLGECFAVADAPEGLVVAHAEAEAMHIGFAPIGAGVKRAAPELLYMDEASHFHVLAAAGEPAAAAAAGDLQPQAAVGFEADVGAMSSIFGVTAGPAAGAAAGDAYVVSSAESGGFFGASAVQHLSHSCCNAFHGLPLPSTAVPLMFLLPCRSRGVAHHPSDGSALPVLHGGAAASARRRRRRGGGGGEEGRDGGGGGRRASPDE